MLVIVASRVMERHPNLSEADVIHAVKNAVASRPRLDARPIAYIGAGPDLAGRLVEWIESPLLDEPDGWYVYHAQTPPTKRMLRELGLIS
ncbi:MAG: hypothetical protein LBL92_00450 [Propionibacteriaceae bacterium]|nr:hypothetical protein [Propionibacteriaceae bacterium]